MTQMIIDNIERQRSYVEQQKEKSKGLGVVFADAFLRGMRDLGYKSPAWALAEQIDNSMQAGATTVAVRFGYLPANKTKVKPDHIALVDNGNGMIPEMISFAVRWGGTDREGDRSGFGRYGYGLPSSSVSIAKRYTVYAKAVGGDWHAVTVDIDALAQVAGDLAATQALLTPKPTTLPIWLVKGAKGDDNLAVDKMPSGVVVILEDLDRLRRLDGWIKGETLKSKLLQHFGVIYRHFVPDTRIVIDGSLMQAVDPLFLMEHGRFFDETTVRAERVETRSFEVETEAGGTGMVRIRASLLPPNFQSKDPLDYRDDMRSAPVNNRLSIMREYNGFLICRAGRHIDTIQPRWTKFQNYDVNIKIEIDFDPSLDEFFNITTAKQQIVLDDRLWEKLRSDGKNAGGLDQLVKTMRTRNNELRASLGAAAQNRTAEEARPSVLAMDQTSMFKTEVEPTAKQREEAERNLTDDAAALAEVSGRPTEEVVEELKQKTSKRKWQIEFTAVPEGPFYRPRRVGEQKQVIINTDHPFYSKVYVSAGIAKAGLEIMLFVLAERELEAKGETEIFYKSERNKWSERLRYALDQLVSEESMQDKASQIAELIHLSAEPE